MPIMIERYGLRDDGGGPGTYRGGLGLDYAIRVFSPRATLTCRGMERTHFRPWGHAGGHPGTQGFARLRLPDGTVRKLGKIDVMELHLGEVLEVGTPCGAGFGDPLEREAGLVLADVLDGYVTAEAARGLYGVVIAGDAVDQAATRSERARLAAGRSAPMPDLSAGPERDTFEAAWPDALQSAIRDAVWEQAAGLRWIVREAVVQRIRERLEAGERLCAAAVGALAQETVAKLRRQLYV